MAPRVARPARAARHVRSISSVIATAPSPAEVFAPLRSLNKTSMTPVGYAERFVKQRGLFCIAVATRCRFGCVSRQDHDRSAVHQLDKDRLRRRAGRGHESFGAGL